MNRRLNSSGKDWGRGLTFHVFLPIAAGAAIYLLFRSTGLRVFSWVNSMGLMPFVSDLRTLVANVTLPDIILYSLPDAAWVYATTCAMTIVCSSTRSVSRKAWVSSGLSLSIGGELAQAAGVLPGTFDRVDVILSCLAFLLAQKLFGKRCDCA